MFRWRKEMERLDVPAAKVRRLYRSLSDIQIALPGFPSQQASAFLCLFSANGGFGIAIVLHLHASRRLAFFLPDKEKIPKQDAGEVLEEGIHFAESMGFMVGDLDFQLLGSGEQASLWGSLPLMSGIAEAAAPVTPAEVLETAEEAGEIEEAETIEEAEEVFEEAEMIEEAEEVFEEVEMIEEAEEVIEEAETIEEVGEAIESGEGEEADEIGELEKDLGIRSATLLRKRKPSPGKLEARRKTLRENLGRFLASF